MLSPPSFNHGIYTKQIPDKSSSLWVHTANGCHEFSWELVIRSKMIIMIEKMCLKGIHSCVLEILRQKGRKNRKKMGDGLTQLTMKPVFRSSVSSQRTLENTGMCSHSPSSRSLFPSLSFYFTLSYQSFKIALVKSLLKQWLLKMEYFAVKW